MGSNPIGGFYFLANIQRRISESYILILFIKKHYSEINIDNAAKIVAIVIIDLASKLKNPLIGKLEKFTGRRGLDGFINFIYP